MIAKRSKRRYAVAALAVLAVGAGACSSSSNKSSSSSSAPAGSASSSGSPTTAAAADPVAKAAANTTAAEKGTNRDVESTPRPAAKGKHIVVISSGQASESSKVPSDAAVEAAKALGWQVDLYDAKLNPASFGPLVRQAIAANADGIVLDAIDCQAAQQPMQEAKAKGIAMVPIYAFDCTDPHAGGAATGVFSAYTNYGAKNADVDAFTESYGADQANYIINATQNKAKIIAIQDPEFTVLYYTLNGFKKTVEASKGSEIVDNVDILLSDLLGGKAVPKIQAELLKHPEANWIKSPYTFMTQVAVVPALGAKAGEIKVMGGEGFPGELDLIRQGKATAANVISSEWSGWAAVDTMNSVFLKQKPADSGIGWTITDKDHNLPASGPFVPPIDFKTEYKKAWGV
ncbi:MAG: hypothetical protein NVS3B21_25620 [Acidimicrobiales bacterium]